MTSVLILDTDVVSFILKNDTRAAVYRSHLEGNTLALSFMTVAELYQWAFVRQWGEARILWLEQQIRNYVIVPYDLALCRTWANIAANRQRIGRPMSVQDAWIAATALRYSCPLVTHNGADFAGIDGLSLISLSSSS